MILSKTFISISLLANDEPIEWLIVAYMRQKTTNQIES